MINLRISEGIRFLVLAIPLTAYAQSPPAVAGDWAALMTLQPRVQLRVIKNDGKGITGFLQDASDSVIVLSRPKARISIMRSDVRRVYKSCPGASVRRSILNLGLLGASVAATVVLAHNSKHLAGAPLGLTYGLLCASRPRRYVLIYESQTP